MKKSIVCIVALLLWVGVHKTYGQNPLILDRLWEVTEFKVNSPKFNMQSHGLEVLMNSKKGSTTYFFGVDSVIVDVKTHKVIRNPIKWIDDKSYILLNDTLATTFFIEVIDEGALLLTSTKYTYSQRLGIVKPSE
jgi:hypothetical protein